MECGARGAPIERKPEPPRSVGANLEIHVEPTVVDADKEPVVARRPRERDVEINRGAVRELFAIDHGCTFAHCEFSRISGRPWSTHGGHWRPSFDGSM